MKFLIVRLSSLGDIVHALPLVYVLKKEFKDAQVDWLVGKKGVDLLNLIPEINNVYPLNISSVLKIQKEKYDFVIDVQGLFKTGLLSKLSFGKEVIGFKNTREFADIFYTKKINVGSLFNTKEHVVNLNLKLLSGIKENMSIDNVKFLIPEIKSFSNKELELNPNKEKILILPATTWESKMWILDYWYETINKFSKEKEVILVASKSDFKNIEPLVKKLEENKVNYKNFIGKTNIKDLIFLIQNVDIVIGLDSGGIHLACANFNDFKKPNVYGIYGPTSVYRNGLYKLEKNVIFNSEIDCIFCRKKTCPLGHHKCMKEIVPEKLYATINTQW